MNTSTRQNNSTVSGSGVEDGDGSGNLDSEVETGSSSDTTTSTKRIIPGLDVETFSSTGTRTSITADLAIAADLNAKAARLVQESSLNLTFNAGVLTMTPLKPAFSAARTMLQKAGVDIKLTEAAQLRARADEYSLQAQSLQQSLQNITAAIAALILNPPAPGGNGPKS